MKYQGFEAIIEYDEQDRLFFGRVINTLDVIAFDGSSVEELESSFQSAVDEYLEDCQKKGKTPNKPFSGRFNLRIPPDLHRQAVLKAEKEGISLNAFVEKALHNILFSEQELS
ncbi:type II toxin-antitoxin system HicB family antitoxin [Gloeocapsa sp. PCC 73106]|uniref:type II toxin-antitoxin system HicB family antitoxin n=1 Tax=Gloeocapsa sp. PCC 73106 TaxID=102232 RepID=UPI0002AC2FB6|nr:type II toxin-antitoxin system HicB family antitoxin [Gloeocapsa sp. PCC 73106]ELR98627.1 protein encoded in hypervariable junctions of pilus gene clusters [Gloeocapsa sp. PCC 73106]